MGIGGRTELTPSTTVRTQSGEQRNTTVTAAATQFRAQWTVVMRELERARALNGYRTFNHTSTFFLSHHVLCFLKPS